MTEPTRQEDLDAARKEGHDDATLAAHSLHLLNINGSLERTADALVALTTEIHKLGADSQRDLRDVERKMKESVDRLALDIRTLNEDQRVRDTALTVAAEGLAKQTEERREALASTGLSRGRLLTVIGIVSAASLTIIGFILANPW